MWRFECFRYGWAGMLPRHWGGLRFWSKVMLPYLTTCDDPEKSHFPLSHTASSVRVLMPSCNLVIRDKVVLRHPSCPYLPITQQIMDHVMGWSTFNIQCGCNTIHTVTRLFTNTISYTLLMFVAVVDVEGNPDRFSSSILSLVFCRVLWMGVWN